MTNEELIELYERKKDEYIYLHKWIECGPTEITLEDFIKLITIKIKKNLKGKFKCVQ